MYRIIWHKCDDLHVNKRIISATGFLNETTGNIDWSLRDLQLAPLIYVYSLPPQRDHKSNAGHIVVSKSRT